MRCKNCNRTYCDGYEDRVYLCRIFGYGDDLDENGKCYIFENSKGEEGCKYTEKQLQKIEKQIREAELEYLRKEDEMFYKRNREKLDKIEDLEDELGCPLEVVFVALDKGITIEIDDLGIKVLDTFERPRLYYSDDFHCYCFELLFGGYVVKLKDYQKTWWLPSDKEWNKNE